jgi:hypothetical protein
MNTWIVNNHMKTCSPNQKGQGHTNGFSWNLTKMVLWIYMWGENTCLGVIEHYIESENFKMVSSNWDQPVLLNKIMYFLSVLLVYLNIWKRPPRMLRMWWNVRIFCPPNKIPYFCMHWRVVKKFIFLAFKQTKTHLLSNFTFIHNVWIWIQVVHGRKCCVWPHFTFHHVKTKLGQLLFS